VIAAAFFVNATLKTGKIQYVFKALACIGRICPNIIICVLRIEKHWQHLTVMDIGRCHGIAPDKSMLHVDTDIVLVAVVIDAVLFNPSRIQVLLLQSVWVFVPAFRHAILFDLLVVFSAIPLPWYWNQRCINYLPATGFEALGPEIGLKLFKQLFD